MENTTLTPVTEFHQITINEYLAAKQEITKRLMSMSEDYIAIGYLLRQIEESEAYKYENGYKNIKEFAKAEFNMSESSVSRFMAINREFSKGGYSKELAEEYRGFGASKLSELLNMSEEDRKLVTATTTVATIREIKEFNREAEAMAAEQEEQIPGQQNVEETIAAYERGEFEVEKETVVAEVLEQVPVNTRTWSDLESVLIEFFRDTPDLLNEIYSMDLSNYEEVVEKINPSGNKTCRHKTAFLFMYGYGDGCILKKMGAPNTNYTWPDVIKTIVDIYKDTYTDPGTVHKNFYSTYGEAKKAAVAEVVNERKDEEYRTPHPENIVSLCYSCIEYETCNFKSDTCKNCDIYGNRAEAHKTEEQRYDEEQAKIDKQTAKKLQEMADEKKMEKLPSDSGPREPQVHEIKLGAEFFEDVLKCKKTFEVRKNDRDYRVGDLLLLKEFKNGEETGRTCKRIVGYMLEDYNGVMDGYCVMAMSPVSEDGQALGYVDVNKVFGLIESNANGVTNENEEYILVEDAISYVKVGIYRGGNNE